MSRPQALFIPPVRTTAQRIDPDTQKRVRQALGTGRPSTSEGTDEDFKLIHDFLQSRNGVFHRENEVRLEYSPVRNPGRYAPRA